MVSIEERNAFIEGHYRLNYHRLVGYMGRKVGMNNAEDVVQEAYCRALQYFDTFTIGADFEVWFMAIWENAGRKVLSDQTSDEDIEEMVSSLTVPSVAEEAYELGTIQIALEKEEGANRQAIVMHMILGFTSEEAGAATGLEPENVRKIVQRFRESLK